MRATRERTELTFWRERSIGWDMGFLVLEVRGGKRWLTRSPQIPSRKVEMTRSVEARVAPWTGTPTAAGESFVKRSERWRRASERHSVLSRLDPVLLFRQPELNAKRRSGTHQGDRRGGGRARPGAQVRASGVRESTNRGERQSRR